MSEYLLDPHIELQKRYSQRLVESSQIEERNVERINA